MHGCFNFIFYPNAWMKVKICMFVPRSIIIYPIRIKLFRVGVPMPAKVSEVLDPIAVHIIHLGES